MYTAGYHQHILEFKRPGGTSRGVLHTKETFILEIRDGEKTGTGECGLFRGLSCDDVPGYEEKLQWLCGHINEDPEILRQELLLFPSIWIGYEQAMLNLKYGSDLYFPGDFTAGRKSITINGLIWMGNVDFMKEQIAEKLEKGFHCLKLKIGIHWNSEKEILQELRAHFPLEMLEIRVDANGGFNFHEAQTVLKELHLLQIHSIEQPIKAGFPEDMAQLCADTPTPVALDEELIGILKREEKIRLLEQVRPQYIILKPSLAGGFSGSDEWISLAEEMGIGWWITSALESNIGLNAIAQYTFTKHPEMPQGLGTGALFTNNFESELFLESDQLWHRK